MAKKEKSCSKATSRRADKDMWMASWHSPRNELKVVIQHQHHISGTCEWQVKRQSQRSAGGEGANKLWDSLIEIATKRGRKQGIIRPKHTPAQLPSAFYLYHLLFLSLSLFLFSAFNRQLGASAQDTFERCTLGELSQHRVDTAAHWPTLYDVHPGAA